MLIRFIGTSHGYPETDRFCSCTVVTVNGRHYVIDAGVSLYSMLLRYGYKPDEVDAIFITHMHGDHTCGLIEYLDLMSWGNREQMNTDVFVPSKQGKLAFQQLVEAMDGGKEVDIKVFKDGIIFNNGDVKVTALKTLHTDASYGFLLEAEDKRVYFSGDMRRDISDCPDFVYNEHTNLIICESAHNCLPLISDKLNNMKTDKIIINHVAPNHSLAEFDECKPLINKPFELAYDSMTVEL